MWQTIETFKSVKGNKSGQKENSRLFEHKPNSSTGILLIYHSVLRFTKNVLSLWNTATYWLMWSFVTRVRQLGSYSLKVQHPVNTTFTHAPTLDCCSSSMCFQELYYNQTTTPLVTSSQGTNSSLVLILRERRNSTLAQKEICNNLYFQIKHKRPRENVSFFMLLFVFSTNSETSTCKRCHRNN